MSRSYKKKPIIGIACASSEKKDKKIWHRRLRAIVKKRLLTPDIDSYIETYPNDAGNVYSMSKDGKQYWDNPMAYRK